MSGKRIYTYKDIIRFVSTKNRRIIYGIFVALNPFRWKYLKLLKSFIKKYDNVSTQAIYVLLALYDFTSILQVFKRKSIVVLDEGFVQNITSIAHLQPIVENEDLTNFIEYVKIKKDIVVINCYVNQNTVIDRIRMRNGRDRFNSIEDDEQLKQAFSIKQANITSVNKYFNSGIDICVNGSTEDALDQLLQKITLEDVGKYLSKKRFN